MDRVLRPRRLFELVGTVARKHLLNDHPDVCRRLRRGGGDLADVSWFGREAQRLEREAGFEPRAQAEQALFRYGLGYRGDGALDPTLEYVVVWPGPLPLHPTAEEWAEQASLRAAADRWNRAYHKRVEGLRRDETWQERRARLDRLRQQRAERAARKQREEAARAAARAAVQRKQAEARQRAREREQQAWQARTRFYTVTVDTVASTKRGSRRRETAVCFQCDQVFDIRQPHRCPALGRLAKKKA